MSKDTASLLEGSSAKNPAALANRAQSDTIAEMPKALRNQEKETLVALKIMREDKLVDALEEFRSAGVNNVVTDGYKAMGTRTD
ncbi:hypothetical protein AC578_5910 [Pseudocercospora eumusae]|uniref:Uncharacterized protein n=1 Tax=Pseudocercospora eumusae TaxID=321146 RepID=A0A139HBG6_9PEZI|nr:hypothetical protein AC578_5910 [Pseudocercospora eumusae]